MLILQLAFTNLSYYYFTIQLHSNFKKKVYCVHYYIQLTFTIIKYHRHYHYEYRDHCEQWKPSPDPISRDIQSMATNVVGHEENQIIFIHNLIP